MTTIKIILVSEPNRAATTLADMPAHHKGWPPYGVQMPGRAGRPVPSFWAPDDGAAIEYADRMFPGAIGVYRLT
jgi:hypothetical protein